MKIVENFMAGLYLSDWLSIKITSSETIPIICFEYFMLALKNNLSKNNKTLTYLLDEVSQFKIDPINNCPSEL